MLNQLKRKALQNRLILAVVLFVVAVIVLWISDFAIFTFLAGPKQMDDMPLDELVGSYVETDVWGMYDYYAYTEQTKNGVSVGITEKEYIVPVGEMEYMGVAVPKQRIDDAEDLLERTIAYLDDETGEVEVGETMHVRGYVSEMDAQTRGFYYETVGYDDMDAQTQAMFLPIVLRDGTVAGDTTEVEMWLFTAIALVIIGLGVYGVINAAIGGYQSSIRKACAAGADPETTMEHIERFYEDTQPIGNVRADENWVMLQSGVNTELLRAQDIAWIHMSTVQHRVYFIPTGKSHALAVWTRDGKKHEVAMPKQEDMQNAHEHLFNCLPEAVFGYSEALAQQFNRDRASFPEIAKQQHAAPVAGAEETEPESELVQ